MANERNKPDMRVEAYTIQRGYGMGNGYVYTDSLLNSDRT